MIFFRGNKELDNLEFFNTWLSENHNIEQIAIVLR